MLSIPLSVLCLVWRQDIYLEKTRKSDDDCLSSSLVVSLIWPLLLLLLVSASFSKAHETSLHPPGSCWALFLVAICEKSFLAHRKVRNCPQLRACRPRLGLYLRKVQQDSIGREFNFPKFLTKCNQYLLWAFETQTCIQNTYYRVYWKYMYSP